MWLKRKNSGINKYKNSLHGIKKIYTFFINLTCPVQDGKKDGKITASLSPVSLCANFKRGLPLLKFKAPPWDYNPGVAVSLLIC